MVNETKLPWIRGHCAVRLENFIIIIGGREVTKEFDPKHGPALSTRNIWRYNLYTEKWEKQLIPKKSNEAPFPFYNAVAVAIEGTIYTFGGGNAHVEERNQLWTLSRTETGDFVWRFINHRCKKESPSPRRRHTGWEYAGKLWVFGGEGPSPVSYLNDYGDTEYDVFPNIINNQLLCYDPDIQKWTNPQCFGEVPSPRTGPCSTIITEKVWLHGGRITPLDYLDDFFQLNMHSLTWMRIQTGQPCPGGRPWSTLTATTDKQLVLHGFFSTWIMDLTSHSWRRYTTSRDFQYDHTATLGLNSSVIILGGCFSDHALGITNYIFHLRLEPMSLQKLAAHTIYKHKDNLAWKYLPKKLIALLDLSDKKQGSSSSSSSSIDPANAT